MAIISSLWSCPRKFKQNLWISDKFFEKVELIITIMFAIVIIIIIIIIDKQTCSIKILQQKPIYSGRNINFSYGHEFFMLTETNMTAKSMFLWRLYIRHHSEICAMTCYKYAIQVNDKY